MGWILRCLTDSTYENNNIRWGSNKFKDLFVYERWVKPKLLFIAFRISSDRHVLLVWPTKSILCELDKFWCEAIEVLFPLLLWHWNTIIRIHNGNNAILSLYIINMIVVCLSTRLLELKYNLRWFVLSLIYAYNDICIIYIIINSVEQSILLCMPRVKIVCNFIFNNKAISKPAFCLFFMPLLGAWKKFIFLF